VRRYEAVVCPFCGCGCGFLVGVEDGEPVHVFPWSRDPVSRGRLCVKGWEAVRAYRSSDRLTSPLLGTGNGFREVSWRRALEEVVEALSGSDEVFVAASARSTNEACYLAAKLARALGVNHVDNCARLCHAPTVFALKEVFGTGAMTNPIDDVLEADHLLVVGSNTAEQHPAVFSRIVEAVESGSSLTVVDPRRTSVAELADVHLDPVPGTDVLLFLYMAKVIHEEGLIDRDFIDGRTVGYEGFVASFSSIDGEDVRRVCGVDPRDVEEAAIEYASADRSSVLYCMGVTHHGCGSDTVAALAALALMTGNVGRRGTGVNPLRGQVNVQGACDVGALPDSLPGYRSLEDKEDVERVWGFEVPDEPGVDLVEAFEPGRFEVYYLFGVNPVSSCPDPGRTVRALRRADVVIVQDVYPSETLEEADVVLPAACWLEETGTYTSTERRVRLSRAVVDPPGDARPDWWILREVGRRVAGEAFGYGSPREVFEEIRRVVPQYRGIDYGVLEERPEGVFWPCRRRGDVGERVLHGRRFATPSGKASFPSLEVSCSAGGDDGFPFVLVTGRVHSQFHTRTVTSRSPVLESEDPGPIVEMNPRDAGDVGVSDGDRVVVETRAGSGVFEVVVTDRIKEGVVFVPFHHGANSLVPVEPRDRSGTPAFKAVPARVVPVEGGRVRVGGGERGEVQEGSGGDGEEACEQAGVPGGG